MLQTLMARAWSGRRVLLRQAIAASIAALVLAALSLAYQLYERRLEEVRLTAFRQLAAITELKATQLETWLEERKADAVVVAADQDLHARKGENVVLSFEAYRAAYGYEAVALFDRAGRLQAATYGAASPSREVLAAVQEAIRTLTVQVEGVRVREGGTPATRVAIVAPLPSGAGAVMLSADPRASLFRTVQQWPVVATSGETLVVEHDGETFTSLTPGRYATRAPQPDALIAAAVKESGGPLEATDYRGVPSLGAAHGVKGTDWLLISKLDAAEVYAPYRREAMLVGALFLMCTLGALAGAAYWRRGQRLRLISGRRVAEERLASVVQASEDAIVQLGLDGRITAWNDGAHRLYGYAANEAIGAPVQMLIPDELRETEAAVHARVMDGHRVTHYETRRRRKDGTAVAVSLAVAPVRDRGGRIVGVAKIARDVSDRRRSEAEQAKLARMYRALGSMNELAARAQSMQELFDGICVVAVTIGEFKSAAVRLVDRQTQLAYRVSMRGQAPRGYERALDMRAGSPDAKTLTWTAYHTGRPAVAAEHEFIARLPQGLNPAEADAVTAAVYPLFRRGECIGVLVLRAGAVDAFAAGLQELLKRMADDVSHALDVLADGEELRRFRLALDKSADLIVIVDTATLRFVDVNGTTCRLLGYSREEMIGMHCTQVLPHSAEELQLAYAELIGQPGKTGSLRSYYRCKDGSRLPFESTRHVLREGDRWLVAAISRDTRERDAAEQALRQKDRYFASLLENVSDTVAVCDMDWRYVYVAPSCTALTGYAPEEFVGQRFGMTMDGADAIRERLERDLAHGPQRLRLPIRRKDGELRVHELIVTRGRGPSGEPIYVHTGRDVTEQERREQEVAALVHNSPDVIARWGKDLRLFFVNDAVARPTGNPASWFVGKRMTEIGAPESFATQWEENLAHVLQTGNEVSAEIAYPGAEGVRQFDARFVPEKDAFGVVASVMTIARDITVRVAAEQELRRRDAFLGALMENVSDTVAVCDMDWRILDVSASCRSFIGHSRDELIGQRFGVTFEDADAMRARLAAALDAGGGPQRLRARMLRRDGEERVQEVVVSKGMGPGGQPIYAVVGRDVTERERREQEFTTLVQNSPDIVSRWGADLRLRFINESVSRLTGEPPSRLVGRRIVEMDSVPAPYATQWETELARAIASGREISIEMPRPGPHGLVHLENRFVPEKDEAGGVRSVLAISRDITDRIRAQEAVAESERRFRALIEHGVDAIVVYDANALIQYRSASVARVTGYSDDERKGRRFTDIVLTEDLPAMREQLAVAIRHPNASQPLHCRIRHKDGSVRWIEGTLTNLLAEPGVGGVVANFRDVTERVRAQEELIRREERFKTLAENSPDGIARFDREGRCVYVNGAVVVSTGQPAEWFIGRTVRDQGSDSFTRALELPMRRVLETGDTETVEFSYQTPRGLRHYQALIAPEHDAAGARSSTIVIARDVTKQKHADQLMRESESRLRAIVHATPAPLLVVTREGEIVFANPAAAEVLGRPHTELAGLSLGLPLADGRGADVEIVLPGGETRPAEMQFAPAHLDGRDVLIVSLHDLSERRQYEEHIEHLANHDALTGLPNRTLLRDRAEQAIIHARRSNSHVALMFVDLDHFKLLNDSRGHAMGDALLMEVGNRLRKTVRDGDTVARLGGDEFVILLSGLTQPADTSIVAGKIAEALSAPLSLEGQQVWVTASIGIALFPSDGDDLDALLQCADAAMYRAKEAGRNGYQYYGAEMGAQARARVETEAGLRQALERGELRLHYQPQIDFATGRIRGFEALMRWQHPSRGMVSPASFIPVAEESGLIVPMGQWALREACRQAAAWSAGGLGQLRVAVNLSARQFWRGGVTEVVRAALAESGLPAAQLELEITESVVARDLQQVTLALEQLRRLGVTVAIDDFGTGYSSLQYLRALPIQKLKIDKSFVQGIPDDPEATALVGEIIRLAHVLALEVVAEGVETAQQARFLREAGCEAMQGFLVARPMPGDECAPLLRQGRTYPF